MNHSAHSAPATGLPGLRRVISLLPWLLLWVCGQAFGLTWSYIPLFSNGLAASTNYYTWVGAVPIGVNMAAAAPGKPGTALDLDFSDNLFNSFVLHARYPDPAQPDLFDWSGPYYLNEVRTVEFDLYVQPDAVGMDHMVFVLDDFSTSDQPRLVDFIPGWDGMTDAQRLGHWYHISINLAGLHPTGARFGRIIFNESGNGSAGHPHPHFLIYDLKYGVLPDTTAPVITMASSSNDVAYTAVTLKFSTNELATYQVNYGVGALNRQVKEVDAYNNVLWNQDHTAVLAGFKPGDVVQYRIIALDHHMDPNGTSNQSSLDGSYTLPPSPTAPPVVSGFATSSVGAHTASLVWNTNRATSAVVSYQKQGGGTAATRTLSDTQLSRSFIIDMLEPDSSYAVTLTVKDVFGLQSAQTLLLKTATSSAGGGAAGITATINAASQRPISPYIYGSNQFFEDPWYTFGRIGGDSFTPYNWTTNAYNYGFWANSSNGSWMMQEIGMPHAQYPVAGELVRRKLGLMLNRNSDVDAALVTVQLQGYVAADYGPDGDVANSGADYLQTRFKQVRMFKNAPFSLMPEPDAPYVYMDEFVNWVTRVVKPGFPGKKIFYSMDNEPDSWTGTHKRIQLHLDSYDSLCQKNEDGAKAVKSVDPEGLVFGFVSYGWYGFTYLQGAPDGNNGDRAAKGDFTDYYLNWMKAAHARAGKRLVDVLDLHFYPSANSAAGKGIISDDISADVVAARVQAPRSLWDPSFVENSWIPGVLPDGDKAIRLIPRIQAKIAADYPGTRLAITEYNYGGGAHISGAVAQADTLGIYGRYGLFAASYWRMTFANNEPFIRGAFRMYRGFDGAGANFGDISLDASSSDVSKVAVYASLDSTAPAPGRAVIVAINRDTAYQDVAIQGLPLQRGIVKAYRMEGTSAVPFFLGQETLDGSTLSVNLPPMSVTTFEIH